MDLSVSSEVLAMLVCPETRQSLHLATADELGRWSAETPFEGALVTKDGTRAYPIRDGFPVVIAAEALELAHGIHGKHGIPEI